MSYLDSFHKIQEDKMPTIDITNNVKINIYSGEHRPPHIHACYEDQEVILEIESDNIFAGEIPDNKLKSVFDWLIGNTDWALEIFYILNPELQ